MLKQDTTALCLIDAYVTICHSAHCHAKITHFLVTEILSYHTTEAVIDYMIYTSEPRI